jgi:quercetin dioxygenase-like cupin family protein
VLVRRLAGGLPGLVLEPSHRSPMLAARQPTTWPKKTPLSGAFSSKEKTLQVTRSSPDTTPGPGDWFTGAVYLDTVATPWEPSRLAASSVHFTPGARTAWHRHPNGQTIYVTEGIGRAQRRGGPVEVIRPGDRVFFEPGEEHWHGAAPNRFMTHLAMHEVDDEGNAVFWGKHVSDDEYSAEPAA